MINATKTMPYLRLMASQSTVWFAEQEDGKIGSQVLPPPAEISKSHEQFVQRVRRRLRIGKREPHIASTKKELVEQIEATKKGISLDKLAQQSLEDALKSTDAHTLERQHGIKPVGKWVQEFGNSFAEFVSAYSSIVDIVQGAGGIYGTAAYQTLSIFLIVFVNKQNNDDKIKDLLDEIRKSLPKLDSWSRIYPTPPMKTLVAAAYRQILDFSRAAIEYFAKPFTRFVKAIISPPSKGVDKIAALIHKTLAEINSEAMFGIHNRSQNIETQVVKSGDIIERLEAQLQESKRQNHDLQEALQEQRDNFDAYKRGVEERVHFEDEQRLQKLEEDLGTTFPSPETDLSETKRCLMQAFPNSPKYVTELADTHFIKLTPDLLKKSEVYRSWISSTDSSLLFLSGATAYEGRRYTGWPHSWLSPAAIYITEDLAREHIHAVFFSCLPGHQSRNIPIKQLLSSILLQVLKKKPQILREKAVQFHNAAVSDVIQNSTNAKPQTREMIRLMREVLAEVKDLGTTFIILDRLDLCEGKINILMDEFAKLVGDPECNVKIAAIAETSTGRGQWHLDQLPDDEHKPDRVLSRQNWNQLRLTTVEINKRERPWLWHEVSTFTWDDVAN